MVKITGTPLGDVLEGTPGSDELIGLDGWDELIGLNGADTLIGGGGADTLIGGAGNDHIEDDGSGSGGQKNIIDGGAGNDTIYVTALYNLITGGSGDDEITLATGHYHADAFSFFTDIEGGAGGDTITLDNSNAMISYASSPGAVKINLLTNSVKGGHAAGDVLVNVHALEGSALGDKLTGDNEVNRLDGGGGADVLIGKGSRDLLVGGDGRDTLRGGTDDDILRGENGADRLFGGEGDDELNGGPGADLLNGGKGDRDQADYFSYDSTDGVKVNLETGLGSGGDAEGDRLVGIESVHGTEFRDRLTGDAKNNSLYGGGGNDLLIGGGGNDHLSGSDGDDTLKGGAGDDVLSSGGDGEDVMNGGKGTDEVSYSTYYGDDGMTINLKTGKGEGGYAEGDVYKSIEDVEGGHSDDRIIGDKERNILDGYDGNDELLGGAGNDILDGGEGDDILTGGAGAADMFVFDARYSWDTFDDDTIRDFDARNSEKIDLRDVNDITSFADLKQNHLDSYKGDARITSDSGTIVLEGYSVSDFGNGKAISANDFLFEW